jgi:hypothetical protein
MRPGYRLFDEMNVLVTAVLMLGLLVQSNPIPLARFSGRVHGVSKKELTIDTEDGNVVEFTINRKTRAERSGKTIAVTDLKTGDAVAIEARQELLGYLVAVTIKASAPVQP